MIQSLLIKKITSLVIERLLAKNQKDMNEFTSNVKELDLKFKKMNARIKAIEDIVTKIKYGMEFDRNKKQA